MFWFRRQNLDKNYFGNFTFFLLKYSEKGTLSSHHIHVPLVTIMKIVLLSQVKALSTTQRLSFVHHSANQNLILEKYRNEICLLDALYKTAKYSIPLFFLAVKTNVDYQIAGSFAVQGETTDAILEAVTILKSSNNQWKPLAFMIDNCNEEISAIEEHFSGSNNNNNAVLYSKLFYLHI